MIGLAAARSAAVVAAITTVLTGLNSTAGAQPNMMSSAAGSTTARSSAPSVQVIASGLHNPRGLTVTGDGTVFVAEAGTGGPHCSSGEQPVCYGTTGSVTRIRAGHNVRVVGNLASSASPDGSSATGPQDVAVLPGDHLGILVGGAGAGVPTKYGVNRQYARLLILDRGRIVLGADFQAFAERHRVPGITPDANPYGLAVVPGHLVVADASSNDVLTVTGSGAVRLLARIPGIPLPGGGTIDPVPTTVVGGPDGTVFVGELTGYPYPASSSRILQIGRDGIPRVRYTGFSVVIDMAADRHGNLFVLQLASGSLLEPSPGVLYRIDRAGHRTVVTRDLVAPTGVAIGPDGSLYVTNQGVSPDDGQVVRIRC